MIFIALVRSAFDVFNALRADELANSRILLKSRFGATWLGLNVSSVNGSTGATGAAGAIASTSAFFTWAADDFGLAADFGFAVAEVSVSEISRRAIGQMAPYFVQTSAATR